MSAEMKQGVYLDISRAQYDAIEADNFSRLKHMGRSAAHYKARKEEPQEDTDALRIGRCSDLLVFQPAEFKSQVVVWAGTRRGKAWDEFSSANASKEILTVEEAETVERVAESVRAALADYLASGETQATVLWRDAVFGGWCKARLDFISTARPSIIDQKTTRDASLEAFGRQAFNLHYLAQAAMYVDGVRATLGEELPYFLAAAEKESPFAVQVYRVTPEQLEMGRQEYRGWLAGLAECRRSNQWPAYSTGPTDLVLPRWAVPNEGPALLSLVSNG